MARFASRQAVHFLTCRAACLSAVGLALARNSGKAHGDPLDCARGEDLRHRGFWAMAEPAFIYTTKLAEAGQAQQSGGFYADWFLNMFAGAIDMQVNSPTLTAVYI